MTRLPRHGLYGDGPRFSQLQTRGGSFAGVRKEGGTEPMMRFTPATRILLALAAVIGVIGIAMLATSVAAR